MSNANFAEHRFVYVLETEHRLLVCQTGFVAGAGTWLRARQFQCKADAEAARADPSWHNDPDSVARARVVRLAVNVTPHYYESL